MAQRQQFDLIYDTEVIDHVRSIDRKYHSLIRRTIEEQLRFAPTLETTNRKPLQRSTIFSARWELHFGPRNQFRVFYRVSDEANEVYILAVGVKRRHKLYISGKEFDL